MTQPEISCRLAAILATDVAGLSRPMGADGVAGLRGRKAQQSAVLPLVAEVSGRMQFRIGFDGD